MTEISNNLTTPSKELYDNVNHWYEKLIVENKKFPPKNTLFKSIIEEERKILDSPKINY